MTADTVVTTESLPENVIDAVRQGRKIEAIKLLREQTGMGLANAKVLVDGASREHGPKKPVLSFADEPSRLSLLAKMLTAIMFGLAGYYFFGGV